MQHMNMTFQIRMASVIMLFMMVSCVSSQKGTSSEAVQPDSNQVATEDQPSKDDSVKGLNEISIKTADKTEKTKPVKNGKDKEIET